MRSLRKSVWSAVAGSFIALAANVASAALVTIDDFNIDNANVGAGLTYTQSNVSIGSFINTVGNSAPTVVFDTTSNADKLTYTFSGGVGNTGSQGFTQTVLLRNDYKLLNDGEWFQLTVNINSGAAADILAGLVLAPLGATNRDNMVSINAFAGNARIRGNVPNGLGNAAIADSANNVFTVPNSVLLRITRQSLTTVAMSYSTDNGANFTAFGGIVNVPDLTTLAVGMYAGNGRSDRLGTSSFDNLVINQVPEPHSIAMAVIGMSGVAFCGWRAKGRK